jgi:hypothetical protein
MTKHELLLEIYNQVDVLGIIKKNISGSIPDGSCHDLYQHIYLILYDMPFSRLYYLLSRKQIAYYIIGIIKNHRQSPYLEFNKYFRFTDSVLPDSALQQPEIEEEEEISEDAMKKLETVSFILHKKYPIENIEKFTQQQTNEFFCVEIYKLYLKRKNNSSFSFTRLAKELKINRNLVSDSIQEAKRLIREEFRKNNIKEDDIDFGPLTI